jgi:hypothetical protein
MCKQQLISDICLHQTGENIKGSGNRKMVEAEGTKFDIGLHIPSLLA